MSTPDGRETGAKDALREALTPPLMEMLTIRFPAWGRDGQDYRYAEFVDRIAGIVATALTEAGFGHVADAKADAWDEGEAAGFGDYRDLYDSLWRQPGSEPTPNPYRAARIETEAGR